VAPLVERSSSVKRGRFLLLGLPCQTWIDHLLVVDLTSLTERLLIHNSSLQRLSAAHHVTLQKAAQLIETPGGVQERRILKSKRAALSLSLKSLEAERALSSEQSESLKNSISKKQRELALRRSKLHAARSQLRDRRSAFPPQPTSELAGRAFPRSQETSTQGLNLAQRIASVQQDWDQVLQQIVHLREKLITQLCTIYTVTLNHPRPETQSLCNREQNPRYVPPGSSAPSWRILGLCLPVSTEIKCVCVCVCVLSYFSSPC
jgi:hypothetical protein